MYLSESPFLLPATIYFSTILAARTELHTDYLPLHIFEMTWLKGSRLELKMTKTNALKPSVKIFGVSKWDNFEDPVYYILII